MPIFLPQEKGHSPSLDHALWVTPFVSCPAPGRRIRPSLFDFRGGLLFEKESPILKGFGVDFSAVLKFTGQQYKTIVRKKHERVFLRTVVLFVASDLYAQIQVAVHHGVDNNV